MNSQSMQTLQFIADSAASALVQIHKQLGPDAVVLSVRRLPSQGVARLWQPNGRIEVLAGLPDKSSPEEHLRPGPATRFAMNGASRRSEDLSAGPASSKRWRSIAWLEAMGLSPAHADRLQHRLAAECPKPPASLDAECEATQTMLESYWKPAPPLPSGPESRTHVFVGPPGSGKTTVLCKWLTLAVLMKERSACVWRLDGNNANTAEFLSVHCEMLGAPVERIWSLPATAANLHFVDLPGVDSADAAAWRALRQQLSLLPSPYIHLVLNAAYETETLLTQFQEFSTLNPTDVIVTHLDEEPRRVKLWNLILGTNCSIRFLSAGQKIPGQFQDATPALLFPSKIHG